MRLHKGDAVEVHDNDGVRRVKTIVRLAPSAGSLDWSPHNEGGDYQSATTTPTIRFAGTSLRSQD